MLGGATTRHVPSGSAHLMWVGTGGNSLSFSTVLIGAMTRRMPSGSAHLMWVGAGGNSLRASLRQASTKGSSCRLS